MKLDEKKQLPSLVVAVLLCFAVAGLGGLGTLQGLRSWYPALKKPYWIPPDWVFGPVWILLYAAMAVAVWLIWRRRYLVDVRLALILFGIQLLLNLAWPWIFFKLRNLGLAFGELAVLWLITLWTALVFWPISRRAALLMIPLVLWTTFAACLNFAIWLLNP